jgi:beta-phosphoglucomutase-like phosphatase (HAD superfamily)
MNEPFAADAVSVRWRAALDAAEDALRAAAKILPADELARHRATLAAERAHALRSLKALARDDGTSDRLLHLTPHHDERRLLGLPAGVEACVFDLEGVLVGSVALHVAAWTQAFDELVRTWTDRLGVPMLPFDSRTDYRTYVHDRPRLEGVRAFLAGRGIALPEGDSGDPPDAETVHGVANHKNELLKRRIATLGVSAYHGSWQYLETALEAGVHTAVVSASENTPAILERAGLAGVVEGCIGGAEVVAEHLRESPAPDRLLAACRGLHVEPEHAAVFETSTAGIVAARAGRFAYVVAIDQTGDAKGADLVVPDLAELLERRLAA